MHNYVATIQLESVLNQGTQTLFISRGSSYLAHLDSEVREEMGEPTKEHESYTNCACQGESHNHQHRARIKTTWWKEGEIEYIETHN